MKRLAGIVPPLSPRRKSFSPLGRDAEAMLAGPDRRGGGACRARKCFGHKLRRRSNWYWAHRPPAARTASDTFRAMTDQVATLASQPGDTARTDEAAARTDEAAAPTDEAATLSADLPEYDLRYRDVFWRTRDYEDLCDRIAIRALLPRNGDRLIEVGAGFGRLVDEYRGYRSVVLFDASPALLGAGRERLGS